jgi:hypothetical protein
MSRSVKSTLSLVSALAAALLAVQVSPAAAAADVPSKAASAPCAGTNPCGGKKRTRNADNPCSGNPCAGKRKCAKPDSDNPCAGAKCKRGGDNPCAGKAR